MFLLPMIVLLGLGWLVSRLFEKYRLFWMFVSANVLLTLIMLGSCVADTIWGYRFDGIMHFFGYLAFAGIIFFGLPFIITILSPFFYIVYWRKMRVLKQDDKPVAELPQESS